jgi:hypothetical protein
MSEKQIKEWKQQIQNDYPHLNNWFIDLTLELYKTNPEYFRELKKMINKEKKKNKESSTQTEFNNIQIIKGEENNEGVTVSFE